MTKTLDESYVQFIANLKNQIQIARVKAHLAVNRELVLLYFKIGKEILRMQEIEGWGSKIIEKVSQDLRQEFPDMTGLSRANLFYMRRFAEDIIVPQLVGQLELPFFDIPWGHSIVLMDQVSLNQQRLWYAKETIKNGWSRNVLMHQIKSDLYKRQVADTKTHNFDLTLSGPQGDLAAELLKDQYSFEFLSNSSFKEKELEDHLVENIVKFLLELGKGYAFIGKQYHLEVSGQDFYLDLLFYNLELRCFVVIELKTGEFKPEYAGKLGFYLSVIDEQLKKSIDQNTIGIILCTKNNKEISKHSMRYMMKPIGVSEYKIATTITDKKIKAIIPSAAEIENIRA
jgi:predicted nuclease of restriction endonuclease-like (RecB) superfamily